MATILLGNLELYDPDVDDSCCLLLFAANNLTGEPKTEKRKSFFLSAHLQHSKELTRT